MYTIDQIGPQKQEKVDVLLKELFSLDLMERQYFDYILKHYIDNLVECNPYQGIDKNDNNIKRMLDNPNVFLNEQFMKQQDTVARLYPIGEKGFEQIFKACGSHLISVAGQQNEQNEDLSQQQQNNEQLQKQELKEEVKEKTNFDIVLIAIDAAAKIKTIKEVRTICNLGLKEAKDIVEKLPSVLIKQAVKEDAEKIQKILIDLGCTIELK